jgi:hypothetical protein
VGNVYRIDGKSARSRDVTRLREAGTPLGCVPCAPSLRLS